LLGREEQEAAGASFFPQNQAISGERSRGKIFQLYPMFKFVKRIRPDSKASRLPRLVRGLATNELYIEGKTR